MHENECDCPACQGFIRPGRPLPVKKILDNIVVQLVRYQEGRDLRMGGFDEDQLTMVAAQPMLKDGRPSVIEYHAEQQRDGWKVWVKGAPRGVVYFAGSCLTGHGWKRPGNDGVYARSGVVTITTPGGSVELELE